MKLFWFSFSLVSIAVLFVGLLCLHLLLYPSVSVERFQTLYPVMEALFRTFALAAGAVYLAWADWNMLRRSAPWNGIWAAGGLLTFYFGFRFLVIEGRYSVMAVRNGWPDTESDWPWVLIPVVVFVINVGGVWLRRKQIIRRGAEHSSEIA